MAVQQRGKAVHAGNLGLYLDRPPLLVPERGLSSGQNFRVRDGQVTNASVGWQDFEGGINLDAKPVTLIEEFDPAGGIRKLILGNTTDLFQYTSSTLSYITPRHDSTGETIDVTNGSPTISGNSTTWQTDGIKAGDFIALGADTVDPTATWYEIQSVDSETSLTLTANYAEATDTTQAYTIRKTFTSTLLEPFVTEIFPEGTNLTEGSDGDRWYATNGADAVVAWDGSTDQVYLPSLGIDTCKAIRRFKNTMVYVAPTVSGALTGRDILTSAIGQPENTSTLEASTFRVYDGSDALLAAEPIGEQLAIYGREAIILAQFVGAPLHFVFRTAVANFGARSARGIVLFPNRHEFFGIDGYYAFDGVAAQQASTHVWKAVTRTSSPNRDSLVQGIIDEGNAEVLWVVPLNGDANPDDGPPEFAYVGHYLEDVGDFPRAHSLRELPATAMGTFLKVTALTFADFSEGFDEVSIRWDDQQVQANFPQVLFGTNAGDIFQLNAQHQDGTVPVSFVRYSRTPLANSRKNGVVHRVYPHADFRDSASDQITVKIRLFDSPNATSVRSTAEKNISLDGSERFAPFRNSGRYVEVEIGSGPTVQGLWSLEGYDMDVVPGGER